GFRNNGPAWLSAQRSGGEPLVFTVRVPEGATVTKSPERCGETTLTEDEKGYLCWVSTPLLEDASLTFPFTFRIDRVVRNARAEVALPEWDNPWDSDQSNDSAWIVLNGSDEPGDGGTPGATTPPAAGEDGGPGTDDADGTNGTNGADGASGDTGDKGTGGRLASTGAGGTVLTGGAALLAPGLGTGLAGGLRRRAQQSGGAAARPASRTPPTGPCGRPVGARTPRHRRPAGGRFGQYGATGARRRAAAPERQRPFNVSVCGSEHAHGTRRGVAGEVLDDDTLRGVGRVQVLAVTDV